MTETNYENRKKYNISAVESLYAWGKIVNEEIEDVTEKGLLLLEIKGTVKECAKLDNFNKQTNEALKKTIAYFDNFENDQSTSVEDYYSKKLGEIGGDENDDAVSHRYMKKFVPIMNGMCRTQTTNSDEQDDVEDEEMVVTQTFTPPVCPYTKHKIVKPIRNKSCNHIYEESTVGTILKSSKCPISSCSAAVYSKNLIPDLKLQHQIENYNKNL